jgi:hypothetical protein
MDGWIKLHRKIEKHWIWDNPLYLRAWIHCLFRANFEDSKVLIGSKIYIAERGSFYTSLGNFGKETGISTQQVRTFWKLLEEDKMINKESTSTATKIIVCKYEDYQIVQQTNNKRTTNEQQQIKNLKKEKEVFNTLSDPPGSDRVNGKEKSKIEIETEKCMPLARTLARIVQSQKNIDITPAKKKSWANEIRKLVYSSEKVEYDRVNRALSWYMKNVGGEYVPVIESGKSLRDKFVKLEAAMERSNGHSSSYKRRANAAKRGRFDGTKEVTKIKIRE